MMARVSAGWHVLCAAQVAAWVATSAAGCGYDAGGEGGESLQDETLFRSGGSAQAKNKGNAVASEGDIVGPPAASGAAQGGDSGGGKSVDRVSHGEDSDATDAPAPGHLAMPGAREPAADPTGADNAPGDTTGSGTGGEPSQEGGGTGIADESGGSDPGNGSPEGAEGANPDEPPDVADPPSDDTGLPDESETPAEGDEGDPAEGEEGELHPLEGAKYDDNEDFAGFVQDVIGFIASSTDTIFGESKVRGEEVMMRWRDVRWREHISVVDANGFAVPGAAVTVVGKGKKDKKLAESVTFADGRTIFYPLEWEEQFTSYRVTASVSSVKGTSETAEVLASSITELQDPAGTFTRKVEVRLDATVSIPAKPPVDIAFVLDATNSMQDEIDRIKATIGIIADRLTDNAEVNADLRFALVAYRDLTDTTAEAFPAFCPFTRDPGVFAEVLNPLQAAGGGDDPESVSQALRRALDDLEWRTGAGIRLIFLVGDAAPKHYYDERLDGFTYGDAMGEALARGIKIFPVASSGRSQATWRVFRQLAQFTLANFIFITEGDGSKIPSGSSDYDHNIDPEAYTVDYIDQIIVSLTMAEMAAWRPR